MALQKKSLRIVRFICAIGVPLIWIIAYINIAVKYMTLQNTAGVSEQLESSPTPNIDLGSLFGGLASGELVWQQALVVSAGNIIAMALLATAVLAIALASIDMRNLEAIKRRSRS